jgi:Serine aminopeptidase, S33
MCCCCPPAINALFCLWFQSGCSKGSVAGALTFFPPDPPLYKFERYNTNGEPVPDDDDYDEEITRENGTTPEANRSNGRAAMHDQDNDEDIVMGPTGHVVPLEEKRMSRGDDHENSNENPANASTAAQQLVERARQLRQRAKVRNLRDAKDRAADITYRVSLDSRLLRSASLPPTLEAIKLPTSSSSGGSHVAVLVYRVTRPNERTKTIIYSHGNATDIGAMFPTQSLLVQALEANVVCFDYSGYGESGGVAEELNTYSDIRAVYKYCVENISPNPKNIVLYGQSVGSGPVCNLAYKNKNLGGIILHSPFTSGMRVLTPSRYVP